ncbi:MAG: hypothetical protein BWY75_03057 [bacterium ADurb.Bin425]|nr:MAG: hypothetical protein BWY75_03057 [bacterium ADurb.Bin425]
MGGNLVQFGTERYQALPELYEQFVLKVRLVLFCIENFSFVFFQIWSDIALGIGERLLANIVIGHQSRIGIGYFDIITKSLVEVDFEALDAGPLLLSFLEVFYPLPTATEQVSNFVQLLVIAAGKDTTFGELARRVFGDGRDNFVAHI